MRTKERDPANNPAKFAVAPNAWSALVGAWGFGARADGDHVCSPIRTPPSSTTTDEHMVKQAGQPARNGVAVVQQPSPVFIYLFSAVCLAVVLVSNYSLGSSELFIFSPDSSFGDPRSTQLGCMHDIGTRRDCVLPLLIVHPIQVTQLFLADIKATYPHIFTSYPFSRTISSPPAIVVDGAVCESPHPFATLPPISLAPSNMENSLVEETKRIAAQFDYTDDDVNKGVREFLRQMSTTNEAT